MVVVSNGVGLSQGEVIGEILSLEVAPSLRGVDDGPLIRRTTGLYSRLEDLLGRNPVVGTGTEALGLIEALFTSFGVKVERKKVFCLGSDTVQRSKVLLDSTALNV